MLIYSQQNRKLQIEVEGFEGQDDSGNDKVMLSAVRKGSFIELSRPFELNLELLSPATSPPINETEILGSHTTVKLMRSDGCWRLINGVVETFSLDGYHTGSEDNGQVFINRDLYQYRARLVPQVKLLRNSRNSRIFHNLKPMEIVQQILKDWQIGHEFKLTESENDSAASCKLEHSVQYEESDFDYISRLLYQAGIYYSFDHTAKEGSAKDYCHKMILRDKNLQELTAIKFDQEGGDNTVFEFSKGGTLVPQLLRINDYDYRQADVDFFDNDDYRIEQQSRLGAAAAKMLLNFPKAGFINLSEKADAAGQRMKMRKICGERTLGTAHCWTGKTCWTNIDAGMPFELTGFPTGALQGFVSRVDFEAATTPYSTQYSNITSDDAFTFKAAFNAQPLELNYRPRLEVPVPKINSIVSATVITVDSFSEHLSTFKDDLGGSQIWLEPETCRVKLLMHWHNTKTSSGTPDYDSMWLNARFSQIWADSNSGRFEVPRRGQEVLVAFADGIPERPVVIGSVYNSSVKPPLDLQEQRNLYSSCLRSAAVSETGIPQSETPLSVNTTLPMSVYELGKKSNQKHFSQISFMNMDNGDFEDAKVDQATFLTEFFLPGAQGPFMTCIEEGKRMAGTSSAEEGSGQFEGINIYSNKDVLNQASQSQFINAGKDINICAGGSLTLQVGRSKLVLKDDGITMINALGDPVWNCGYNEDYRKNDANPPDKPKIEVPSFSSSVTLFPGYAGMAAPQTEILGTYKSDLKTWFGSEISSTLGHLGIRGLNLSLGGGSTLVDVFSDLNQLVKQLMDTINTNVEGRDGSIVPEAVMAGCTVIDSIMFIKDIFVEAYAVITALKAIFGLKSSSIEMGHESLEMSGAKIVQDGLTVDKNGNLLAPYIGTVRRAANKAVPGSGSLAGKIMSQAALSNQQVSVATTSKRSFSDDDVSLSSSSSNLNSSDRNISKNNLSGSGNDSNALGSSLDLSASKSAVVKNSSTVSSKENTAVKSETNGLESSGSGLRLSNVGSSIVNTGMDMKQ
ncbi:type VI secretion system tip protein TssI/VgrG [Lentisphaerota bacterium ZTH]|nr:type VI secretion system tip protein VgrG [Lentisphaerota bacterium]WET05753.1 type VI secretion system tip protein TssI/VgrG [Lentisphaerota bacterium ZTH]